MNGKFPLLSFVRTALTLAFAAGTALDRAAILEESQAMDALIAAPAGGEASASISAYGSGMALQGLTTLNQAMAEQLKVGL